MDKWQPQTIRRFVRGFPTSARTALVETDDGRGYLKAMGAPEGLHTLAAEVVATQLAAWFGLSTFDWCLITVDELDEIPFVDHQGNQTGRAEPGPAFITRAEQGTTWGGSERELKCLVNPQDLCRLVVFDTWLLNCDRFSQPDRATGLRRKPNYDNVFLSGDAPPGQFLLKSMDHTHCFTCGREWTRRLGYVDTIREQRLFGLFPEFRPYLTRESVLAATSDLKQISKSLVWDMIQLIPDQWCVSQAVKEALLELIVGRANWVAETLTARLWPQGSLFPEQNAEDPEL